MVDRVARYRPQEHSGEAAVATRSNHQEIGLRRSPQEHFRGMPLRHFTGDRSTGFGCPPQRISVCVCRALSPKVS